MWEDGLQSRLFHPPSCPRAPWRQCHVGKEPPFHPSFCLYCPDCPLVEMGLCWVGLLPLSSPPSSSSGQHQAAPSQRLGQPHGPPVLLQAACRGHQENRSGCRLHGCGLGAAGREVTTPGVHLLQCHWYCAPKLAPGLPWPGSGRKLGGRGRVHSLEVLGGQRIKRWEVQSRLAQEGARILDPGTCLPVLSPPSPPRFVNRIPAVAAVQSQRLCSPGPGGEVQ